MPTLAPGKEASNAVTDTPDVQQTSVDAAGEPVAPKEDQGPPENIVEGGGKEGTLRWLHNLTRDEVTFVFSDGTKYVRPEASTLKKWALTSAPGDGEYVTLHFPDGRVNEIAMNQSERVERIVIGKFHLTQR